jgi:ketosteroid isomerase-like protein
MLRPGLAAGPAHLHLAADARAPTGANTRRRCQRAALRYDVVRRAVTDHSAIQQHVLRGALPNGAEVALHAAMYLQVRDGHITRIEEYLDSAQRSAIRAAREALSA